MEQFARLGTAADQPALDEIALRMTEWRKSFDSLRVVWELRHLPSTDEPIVDWSSSPKPESAPLFSVDEWISADTGLDLLDSKSSYWTEDATVTHTINVFNGHRMFAFQASYLKPPHGTEELKELKQLDLGTGKPRPPTTPQPVHGLYWANFSAWLPEMLGKWRWKMTGIEDVCGESCLRIIAARNGVAADATLSDILWLDLKHGGLVRRHQSPFIPGRRSGSDFVVDEFQELENGIWFPKRGRHQISSTNGESLVHEMFVVTEVELNPQLDLTRFDSPTPGNGTVLVDSQSNVIQQNLVTFPSTEDERDRETNIAISPPQSDAPPATAWLAWSAVLLFGTLACLAIGLMLGERKPENQRQTD